MVVYGYNIAAQIISLVFLILVLMLLLTTKPKKTPSLKYLKFGIFCGIINTVACVLLCWLMEISVTTTDAGLTICAVIFYISHHVILSCLYLYVHTISANGRLFKGLIRKLYIIATASYAVVMTYLFVANKIFKIDEDGVVAPDRGFFFFIYWGVIVSVAIMILSVVRRNSTPHIFRRFVFALCPIDVVVQLLQIVHPNVMFFAVAYAVPFVLVYVVFNSVPYDEYTGCQSSAAFETHYLQMHRNSNNRFWTVIVQFPGRRYTDRPDIIESISRIITYYCRLVELMSLGSRVYMLNEYTIAIIMSVKNEYSARQNLESIDYALRHNLANASKMEGVHTEYKMIAFREHPMVATMSDLGRFTMYLFEMLEYAGGNVYTATYDDFVECQRRWAIEKEIIHMKERGNLDDPRVLCYVQPIYDVKSGMLRSAEALMRLKIKGQMIFPDTFIPMAERNGCIHTLTKIILNKVCVQVKRLEKEYDFDTISVNVSSSEFTDSKFAEEILAIIKNNGVDPAKIRIEMTESMMYEGYDQVRHNMEILTKEGVGFYLDDFGTGFSNFERILTMPFSTVKFDKSLLYKAFESDTIDQLIKSLVGVFKNHGFVTLVEGVENDEQSDYSKRAGFDYIQGYKYARPMPIDSFRSVLQEKNVV